MAEKNTGPRSSLNAPQERSVNARGAGARLDTGQVVIGAGADMRGEISNCTVLEVMGRAEGEFNAGKIVIHSGGELHGQIDTQQADVSGVLNGTVSVEDKLDIRETGVVSGELVYGQLGVEPGGSLTGNISGTQRMGQEAPRPSVTSEPRRASVEPVAELVNESKRSTTILSRLTPKSDASSGPQAK